MTNTTVDSISAPSLTPPGTESSGANDVPGTSTPTLLAGSASSRSAAASIGPSLLPATAAGVTARAAGAVTGTWVNGKTVNAMWATNEIRNAFMSVAGVGWLKIFNGTDGAFTALTTLASQARQTGHTINYRVESDGMVHEIYLW